MSETKSARHNRVSAKMIHCLAGVLKGRDPVEARIDALIIGESVIVGIALICIRLGGDNIVLDQMFERAKARLAEIRLKEIKTEGAA